MSLLVVQVGAADDWACVAADTDSTRLDSDERSPASKLWPLPHLNAVLAFTGSAAMGFYVAGACGLGRSLAQVIEGMPTTITQATAALNDALAKEGLTPTDELDGAIVLVAYDDDARHIVAKVWNGYKSTRDAVDITATKRRRYFTPWSAEIDKLDSWTPTDIERMARAQVAFIREKSPTCAGGGNLILARVSEAQMTIRKIARLGTAEWGRAVESPYVLCAN